jgi:D-tagatose-1,6-bisphosphate aldolase subunit GatZ/KbaZ
MQTNLLDEIVHSHKSGKPHGITSICSAHPYVLETSMRRATQTGAPLLIESTCNQVNQFGGYTGMTPADFVVYLRDKAEHCRLKPEQLILGGDHLGPSVWQNEPVEIAMQKSETLVNDYVRAGFTKIHLDASMKLKGDNPDQQLDVEISSLRAAHLAKIAEIAYSAMPDSLEPRYVIGTEVPIPGGAKEHEEGVIVTKTRDVRHTIDIMRQAFLSEGLEAAWERVIAVVVQPGVEFGDDFVLDYKPDGAQELSLFIEGENQLIYEAHSTDYQTRDNLRNLVRDHFGILKVGPALTYAFRKAIFALAMMENEILNGSIIERRSNIITVLDDVMQKKPGYWQKYYSGTSEEQAYARKFSLSDRIRYYWPTEEVQRSLGKLLDNLCHAPLPFSLLDQYVPAQFLRIRNKELENTPQAIVADFISDVLHDYEFACQG